MSRHPRPTSALLQRAVASITLSLTIILPMTSAAATYPEKPVTVIVPYAAGGITDLSARALSEGLSKELGQPFIVMNRPGASGAIGGAAIATAAPDGYTLGFLPLGASTPEVFRFSYSATYKSTDLRAISSVTGTALTFAVRADSPLKTMQDLVAAARQKGSLMIGTSGSFTLPSMVMVNMERKEGIKLENVNFGADSKTLPALLGGHVDVAAVDYAVVRQFADTGKVRLLATCTEERVEFAPEVPTVRELGYAMPYVSALGLFGPARLPDVLVGRLDAAVAKVTADASFREKVRALNIMTMYKNSGSFQRATFRDRDNLERFFTEAGAYK